MADYLEVFNKTLIEFIDDLITTFPTLADFQTFRAATVACVLVDKATPCNIFHKTVTVPYESFIINKNEEFFLQEDYSNKGADSGIVDRLKLIWKDLDDANKETIWNYMRVLVTLSKKFVIDYYRNF